MTETVNASKSDQSLGITQRTTPLAISWTGELRVRFTDFLVNEIEENGTVVRLTDVAALNGGRQQQSRPTADGKGQQTKEEKTSDDKANEDKPRQQQQHVEPPLEVSAEDKAALSEIAGESFVNGCIEMLEEARIRAAKGDEADGDADGDKLKPAEKKFVTAEPTDDRSKRALIHQEVRRIFNSKLDTNTNESGVIIASVVETRRGKKRGRGGVRHTKNRDVVDEPRKGEYLHFTLYKENRDTMDAVNQIARMLRLRPQAINYAGTKDRRAATAQRCSVRHIRERALAGTNPKLRGVFTGGYEYKERPIHLGELLGNEFAITIKNCRLKDHVSNALPAEERVKALDANIQPALDHLVEHGWINYFGQQRFGTHEVGTHEIGKLILGDKFEEAVTSLLSYSPDIAARAESGDIPDGGPERDIVLRHQACMLFMTGKDRKRAQEVMPRRFNAEVCLLRHLNRNGQQTLKDWVGAVVHITRGLRTMYLHAYQSHVWNHVASRRWELHGSKVVKGDLVVDDSEPATQQASQQDEEDEDVINPVESDEDHVVRARPITEEEAASGRFTIHDVVLPTPGYEVTYPDNELGEFYTEFMAREENGSLDPHGLRRVRREFSLPGRYRSLISKFIGQPSIEVKAYTHDTDQLYPTDLDLLNEKEKEAGGANKRTKTEDPEAKPEDQDTTMTENAGAEETPHKIAVTVKFSLRSSAYATVALRELMGDFTT